MAKRPKLPPLQRYQLDIHAPGLGWEQQPETFFSSRAAQEHVRVSNLAPGSLVIIRNLYTAQIVWRNVEARKAGF